MRWEVSWLRFSCFIMMIQRFCDYFWFFHLNYMCTCSSCILETVCVNPTAGIHISILEKKILNSYYFMKYLVFEWRGFVIKIQRFRDYFGFLHFNYICILHAMLEYWKERERGDEKILKISQIFHIFLFLDFTLFILFLSFFSKFRGRSNILYPWMRPCF